MMSVLQIPTLNIQTYIHIQTSFDVCHFVRIPTSVKLAAPWPKRVHKPTLSK